MIELDRGHVYTYEGNYAAYLELRQARLEQEEASAEKRRNLIRRETAWIRRGAQARSTKQKARRDRARRSRRPAATDTSSSAPLKTASLWKT